MTTLAKEEHVLREEMVRIAASFSSAAMLPARQAISLLLPDGNILATPTGSCLGNLDPQRLSKWTRRANGSAAINRLKRCVFIWRCIAITLAARPWYICTARSTALSCLEGLDPQNVIRPFTPMW